MWLDNRLADAPTSLRARVLTAAEPFRHADLALPAALQAAAESLLREAQAGPPGHDTALRVLAADALITFACGEIALSDPARLGA